MCASVWVLQCRAVPCVALRCHALRCGAVLCGDVVPCVSRVAKQIVQCSVYNAYMGVVEVRTCQISAKSSAMRLRLSRLATSASQCASALRRCGTTSLEMPPERGVRKALVKEKLAGRQSKRKLTSLSPFVQTCCVPRASNLQHEQSFEPRPPSTQEVRQG